MRHANISAYQNSFVDSVIMFKNDNGTPFNLTNYVVEIIISKHNESVNRITLPLSISSAVGGECRLSITSPQTLTIPVGYNVYNIFATHPTLGTLLLQQGTFFMNATNAAAQ